LLRRRPGFRQWLGARSLGARDDRHVRIDFAPAWHADHVDEKESVMDRAAEVRDWLQSRTDEMAELLEQLVAIDTENPPGRGLGRCGRVLRDAMERLGLSPEVIELAPTGQLEEPCIVRGAVGGGARTIYFHGHFDVVPAQSSGQFRPERRDGKIIGRGSADMKGGLVSMLYGAAAAQQLGLLADGRIVFHFVCDEETGSVAGSGHLREAGLIDPDALAMVTGEPTGGVVWHANRGAITLRVDVRGREAHVGQAHLGINAFEHMIRVAEPLSTLAHELAERRTEFPMDSDAARGSMLVVGGSTGAGASFNVVPGSAWFSVDRRFNPEEQLEEELDRLIDTINEAAGRAGADVTIDVLQRAPSAGTDDTQPTAVTLAQCITEVEGSAPKFEMCSGVLETRWYAQLGIPAFAYGAGRLDVSHGPDEFIDEAAMGRCAAVYALFAGEMLAG
jgi:acetylornithine deacetylase/succinyl-diaminopimelate desuccinylase-like protein